ncbi:signal recognition particle-docking protein FtsY [Pseudomonas petrae]|uniref:Signal recognition particle receptor FtsY n=1 Tax=Pseudomonas petrae TaxID=2912190 RepID=A0ABS9IBT7_9PSED|nr:signal recognition particle-docking protein FtsY [Pseudomonas petrae]MCF7537951.1 signal recognition particle-docking protein FtsY [Pseudomonas petrae]MCF7545173.1 signal recognition particle-docking protein FtsY [Pseudomonas petrae]MCF7555297.1 signal recognition particle-docking protein FtsY [Pseudomonas petrae]
MFGSNDDKKTPAPAGEKKGLFGWLRKKPQEVTPEPPQNSPAPAPESVPDQAPAVAEQHNAPVIPAERPTQPAPQPLPQTATTEALSAPVEAPWLHLPVAEEPVAFTDEREPHVTPSIPAHTESNVESAAAPLAEVPAQPAVIDTTSFEVASIEPTLVALPDPVSGNDLPSLTPPLTMAPMVPAAPAVPVVETHVPPVPFEGSTEPKQPGFFARLKQGLSKTSASLGEGMASLFLGKKAIDDDMLDELETRLLTADVGVEATSAIVRNLTQKVARKQLTDSDALYKSLQNELTDMLKPVEAPLVITSQHKPFVILVVGVNGAGKTTTIGKLAKKLQLEGKKVMLAAGDTFRAAAVEQLQVWGERNKIPVIAQHTGADSASVIFDAVQAAKARGVDVLIADTAGRLHTKDNLMEELKKVRRVIGKLDADAPHEVLLVLDAGTGQNAINQAKQFNQTVQLTGLALTKLDGTAKGGVIFALAKQFGLPIRYIGVGEGIDDLRTFEAEPFVQALFAERERP